MSFYGKYWKIGGLIAGPIMRHGNVNGSYSIIFERGNGATLEGIEAIDWAKPDIERLPACQDCETCLPEGYGFTLEKVTYDSDCRSFTVMLQTAKQYLGDVTGYQAQLEELRVTEAAQAEKISGLEQLLAEANEAKAANLEQIGRLEQQMTELTETKAVLEEENTALAADKTSLEQQLAEADEAAIALYEALSAAEKPAGEEDAV